MVREAEKVAAALFLNAAATSPLLILPLSITVRLRFLPYLFSLLMYVMRRPSGVVDSWREPIVLGRRVGTGPNLALE